MKEAEVPEEIFEVDKELYAILRGDVLGYVKKRLDKVIVGEDENKMTLFLALLSYLRPKPIHVILKGPSGVGKSWLLENVAKAFPTDDVIKVTRVTPSWIDRCAEEGLRNKIVIVQQLGGAEASKPSFHVMMSEGRLVLGTVRRNPDTGDWESYERVVEGPVCFASTTALTFLDVQMETRTLAIYPDASEEQTKRIQQRQAEWEAYPWLKEEAEEALREVRKIVEWLRDCGVKKVVIPFAEYIRLPVGRLRVRRDWPKFVELVKSLAMLRQMNRYIVEVDEERYVLADWKDVKDAIKIAGKIFAETLAELNAVERKILETAKRLGEFTARDIAPIINKSQRTTRNYLNALVEKGYLFVEEGRGRIPNVYTLNPEVKPEEAFKSVFAGITDLNAESQKEALRKWLSRCWKTGNGDVNVYRYDDEGGLVLRHRIRAKSNL